MDLIQTIILSIVEGVSEFLPISSTGHLVLTAYSLNIPQTPFVKSFEIIIQLGAILSIITLYTKIIIQKTKLWKTLFIAFMPSAVVGFTLYPFIKNVLIGNPFITVIALIVGGIILIIIEYLHKEKNEVTESIEDITSKQAIFIGIAQSFSIVPGVSRAGATIIGGLLTGAKRKVAVEFSFLLALPTMMGATALDLVETNLSFSSSEWITIGIGFITSYFVALIAVKWLLKYVQNHTFIGFGVYRIIFGIIYWLIYLR